MVMTHGICPIAALGRRASGRPVFAPIAAFGEAPLIVAASGVVAMIVTMIVVLVIADYLRALLLVGRRRLALSPAIASGARKAR